MSKRDEARMQLMDLARAMQDTGDPEFAAIVRDAVVRSETLKARYRAGAPCPWGEIESSTEYAPGITLVETSSHGGFILSRERFEAMPRRLRELSWTSDQHFEEDEAWTAVAATWPDLFDRDDVEFAKETVGPLNPIEMAIANRMKTVSVKVESLPRAESTILVRVSKPEQEVG